MLENFDIIVLGGQSNAEGYGIGDVAEEYICDERIMLMNDDSDPRFEKNEVGKEVFKIELPAQSSISVAVEPLGASGKVGKLALVFAKNYIESGMLEAGRRVLIINAAVGGTGFARNEWGKNGILYERLKKMTKEALNVNKNSRIVVFLWHQGECDAFENPDWLPDYRYEVHKNNLAVMLDDFEESFDCCGLPMISAGFCDEWYLKNKMPCDAVKKAICEVFKGKSRRFLETSGLESNNEKTGNGDDIHFSRESLYILGKRYFQAYVDIVKGAYNG